MSEILNKKPGMYKILKEKNFQTEKIKSVAILISGKNIIKHQTIIITYLITFVNSIVVFNKTYENIEKQIWNYERRTLKVLLKYVEEARNVIETFFIIVK